MLSRLMTRREQAILTFLASATVIGSLALYVHDVATRPAEPTLEDAVVAPVAPIEHLDPPAIEPIPLSPEPQPVAPPLEVNAPSAVASRIAVSIQGAVWSPGVYEFAPNARVQNLVEASGGVLDHADLSDINLAAPLLDGTTLTVPSDTASYEENGTVILERRASGAAWNPPEYTISGWRNATVPPVLDVNGIAQRGVGYTPGAAYIDLNRATAIELETLPGIGPKLAESIVRHRADRPFRRIDDLMNVSGIGEKRYDAVRDLVSVRPE
ncbi:MAG: helix-hairpin-helix domain-containing protein [Candidatus Hydrogenedentes bacterium]|nr:helix-hairpin-helix domain-containing protein [Candidatus Hydrogenedentota bacterium]